MNEEKTSTDIDQTSWLSSPSEKNPINDSNINNDQTNLDHQGLQQQISKNTGYNSRDSRSSAFLILRFLFFR